MVCFFCWKSVSVLFYINDLAQKLVEKAMDQKNSLSKYKQSHLTRLKRKPEKASPIADTPRIFRKSVSAKNFTKACFFCDAKNDKEALNECQTLCLDMRVQKIAHEMLDMKRLKKTVQGRHGYYRSQIPSIFSNKTVFWWILGNKNDGDLPLKKFQTHPVLFWILTKLNFTNNLTQRAISRTNVLGFLAKIQTQF